MKIKYFYKIKKNYIKNIIKNIMKKLIKKKIRKRGNIISSITVF